MTAPLDDLVLGRLAAEARLLVCCDFDGTLSHLVDDPGRARPVPGAVEVLDRLGSLPGTTAAVLSGRSLADLAQLAGVPDHVRLVGSHGAEFAADSLAQLDDDLRHLLGRLVAACDLLVEGIPGAATEVKPASVAVHVRRAEADAAAAVLEAVRTGPATWPGVHATAGKQVLELAVVRPGKGGALRELGRQAGATATIFFGDDVTDEDAFAILGDLDVGVKVGPGPTLARWRVGDPDEVVTALARLADLRPGE